MADYDFHDFVKGIYDRYRHPGLSVTIVHQPDLNGEWVQKQYQFGEANVKGSQWSSNTIHAIQSVSKHITCIALDVFMRDDHTLSNGKKLGWNTPVIDVFPKWDPPDRFIKERCTLTDLATMRSGIPAHDLALGDLSPDEVVDLFSHLQPNTGLRQTFQYSNLTYFLLGHIVPTLSGQPFTEFVKERMFEPLDMLETTNLAVRSDRDAALATGRMADGYKHRLNVSDVAKAWDRCKAQDADEVERLPEEFFGPKQAFRFFDWGLDKIGPGAGHVLTTPIDMAKWMRELIDPKVLSKETVETITKPRMVVSQSGSPEHPEEGQAVYGLGMTISQYRGHNMWSHGGGMPGYVTMMQILPQQRLGIALMSNDDTIGASLPRTVMHSILDRILGLDPPKHSWEFRGLDDWVAYLCRMPTEARKPEHPRPSPMKNGIAGKYSNAGYGEMEVKLWDCSYEDETVLAGIQGLSPISFDLEKEIWIVDYPRWFINKILFQHIDGPKHYCYIYGLYDQLGEDADGDTGKKGKVVWKWNSTVAVFDEKGFGVFDFCRAGDVDEKKPVIEADLERSSEVWFDRIV